MQTTLTATLFENQDNIELIKSQLYAVVQHHSLIQRKLYKDIVSYKLKNKVKELPGFKINELKSSYQLKYKINARQYNSIYNELTGKISSILELNKGYMIDTKDTIQSLEKAIKTKDKALKLMLKSNSNIINKILNKDKNENIELDKTIDVKNKSQDKIIELNIAKLKSKLFYLNQKLDKARVKLKRLELIEKTGNPQLCFGSNKLFRQQFEIEKSLINPTYKNLTKYKSFESWKKDWIESRNKSFFLVGSCDETMGNQNCQIKHIVNNLYELKININPKELKIQDRFISIKIYLHNDKNNAVLNAINNNLNSENKGLRQAISYRFYKTKFKGKNSYKILISLDKAKQQPKVISSNLLGCIGVDINANHLAVAETDRFGNLVKVFNLELDLKDKTTEQSKALIGDVVKELTDYAKLKNKPIVIEKLDFTNKKKELKSGVNKGYNSMLSSFAYSKILELIKSRSFDKGIETIEVNPAYTSKIGKFKYQNQYKLTTHQAAAFVIARRGLLSYTKNIKVKVNRKIKEEEELANIIDGKLNRNGVIVNLTKNKQNEYIEEVIKDDVLTIENKERKISNRRSKYYCFDLPVRNNQGKRDMYWKDIELNYTKAKQHRKLLKKSKKLLLSKQDLLCEITEVANNLGVNCDSNPSLLF